MTKEEITEIVMKGATGEYSHCVTYCDHWDYTYNGIYVRYGEDINEIIDNIESLGSPGMYTIEEIYNYNLDLDNQLNERRAYHIKPLYEDKKVIDQKDENIEKQDNMVSEECDSHDNVDDLSNSISEEIGIIDYLLANAKLSKTQVTTIEQIICSLLQLSKDDNIKIIKLIECLETCSKLKASFQNENDIFSGLMGFANYMNNNRTRTKI